LWLTHRWRRLTADAAITLLTAATIAELVAYIPLGNSSPRFLADRLALSTLIVGCGLLLCLQRPRSAAGLFAVALATYGALIVRPDVGLPRQFNLDQPPEFLKWLQAREGQAYRSFGIAPDHSSIGPVQDISAVGPLAPQEYAQFVHLVSDEKTNNDYATTTHFMLAGPWSFGLDQYERMKPIFDWLGVRYLVLDRDYFNPRLTVDTGQGDPLPVLGPLGWGARTDNQTLLATDPSVRQVYVDFRSVILESTAARPKAEFWATAELARNQRDALQRLKKEASCVLGAPLVEAGALPRLPTGGQRQPLPV
jgi:hypothetical protein